MEQFDNKKNGRINIRIEEDLRDWAYQFARDNRLTLTDLFTLYLESIRNSPETAVLGNVEERPHAKTG